ncbi:sigma-70 family RNA polymerase sigma factor [Paradesulfitobacterium aromaticivorans]
MSLWTENVDDPQLVAQACNDPEAFTRLYNLYFGRVYNYIRCRVQKPDIADDLTSKVFERVLVKLSTYHPELGQFAGWLWSIVRNTVADYFRQQKRHPSINLDAIREIGCSTADPADRVIERETQAELLEAIKSLSQREQDLLGLKYWACLSNKQIAVIAGLNETNVAVIIYRATRRLAERLAPWREKHG